MIPATTLSPPPPRPLGVHFVKNTFHYELVQREGDVAIYKQRLRPGVGCMAYEVIIVRVAEAGVIMGNAVPRREVGPSNESFGVHGWSYNTLERAKKKYNELVASR